MKNDQTLPLIEIPRKAVDDDMMYFCNEDDVEKVAAGVTIFEGFDGDNGSRNFDSGFDQTDSSESSGSNRGSKRRERQQQVKDHTGEPQASVSRTDSVDSFLPNISDSPEEARKKEVLSEELRLNLSDTSLISQKSNTNKGQNLPKVPVSNDTTNNASPRPSSSDQKPAPVRPQKVSFEDDSGLESFRNEEGDKEKRPKREASETVGQLVAS